MISKNHPHPQGLKSEAKEVREYTDKQESRCKAILNRLSRIQIDLLHSHTQEQLKALLKQTSKKSGSGHAGKKSTSNSYTRNDPDIRAGLLRSSSSLSPKSQGTNCTEIESSSNQKKKRKYDISSWKKPDIAEITHVNSSFKSLLGQACIGNVDLDETESSSGDSSCDETMFIQEEADGTPKRVTHYLPVKDNPAYKFAEDRAKIIAVWTWLQDAIANLTHKIKQQDEFLKHLMNTKPPFQFDEHPTQTVQRLPNSRPPSNAALKDACIQIFTANNNSQVPPTSTQVFYAGERKAPYITDASGKVIQLMPPPSSSSSTSPQKLPNGDAKATSMPSPQDMQGNSIVGGGLESLGLTIQINHDPSCTARRCMPLKPYKQRKIYQLGGIHNMSSFSGRAPTLLCSCFGRTELCAVCSGRARKTKAIDVEVMDEKEVLELLDHNYHRKLSLPAEVPIAPLIESSLKREGWTGLQPRNKSKFKRLSLGWERPRSQWIRGTSDEFGLKKRPRGRPRLPRGIDQFGQVIIKHPKPTVTPAENVVAKRPNWRNKEPRNPISRRASYGGVGGDIGGIRRAIKMRRKKYNSISCVKGLSKKRERDSLSDEDGFYDVEFQNFEDYDGFPGNKAEKRLSQSGRKLNQDYDIDNIVIPYSIASSTRVEKIEYKEILTPSWRVVSDFNPEKTSTADETLSTDGENEFQTDLNEDIIKIRHDRCEIDEHKRFHSVPDKISSRRGTRRLDSRNESLELLPPSAEEPSTTIDSQDAAGTSPSSPADGAAEEGMELESIASKRRRTISSTSQEVEERIDTESTPWGSPFEPRYFPLTDEEYEAMLEEMPPPEEEVPERRRFSPPTVPNLPSTSSGNGSKAGTKSRSTRDRKSFSLKGNHPEDDKDDDGDLELMDCGEESDGDDDPDWQRPPGERAA